MPKDSGFNTAFSLAGIDLNHELHKLSAAIAMLLMVKETMLVTGIIAPKKFAPANTSNQGEP